jgi:hypothetical protein
MSRKTKDPNTRIITHPRTESPRKENKKEVEDKKRQKHDREQENLEIVTAPDMAADH